VVNNLFFIGTLLLAGGALFPFLHLVKEKKLMRRFSLTCALAGTLIILAFSITTILGQEPVTLSFHAISPEFTLLWYVDRLAAFFLLLISMVSACAIIYSYGYIEHIHNNTKKNFLTSMMCLFIIAMMLVVTSANYLTFLFFWEIMSVVSFLLVMFDYQLPESRKAGQFYFIMTQLSTVFLIIGFILLSNTQQQFLAGGHLLASPLVSIAFVLLFIGFAIKAGVIPFHKWLPYAHPASPSNISALMSGVMIKVAIYGIIRFILAATQIPLWWGLIILFFGALSALLGAIYMLKEQDIKRLLAYCSIENIGVILLGIGLSIIFSHYQLTSLAQLSLAGALFHAVNHALIKSLLFMTAGSAVNATKTRNIEKMGGLIKSMPYTAVLFLIGAIAISALPPFNGFVSELMIFTSLFHASALPSPFMQITLFVVLSVLALTSALAAASFVKAFGITFLAQPRSSEAANAKEAPLMMLIGPGILAVLCLFFGIFATSILQSQGFFFPLPNMLFIGIALLGFFLLVALITWFLSSHKQRTTETWGCGHHKQDPTMEYTSSGFSEPIVTIFSSIYRTKKVSEKKYEDEQHIHLLSGTAQIKLFKLFEEHLYLPIAGCFEKISAKIGSMQDYASPDVYLFYIFLTCITLLIIIGWFT
jgi:formate hydrogenlyase subunit 3/multisubunit Na+/H+ antiporter MnhD subunit